MILLAKCRKTAQYPVMTHKLESISMMDDDCGHDGKDRSWILATQLLLEVVTTVRQMIHGDDNEDKGGIVTTANHVASGLKAAARK
ncbi:Ectonucleotide Pyrophosphatase/Phosphodiesterase Family Member 1 [Manis pentadactyla]|nr:Ectonucleotide Pyrophosphatase/Phosphodiesterase Family Member 1 [Manis pentadactyla]